MARTDTLEHYLTDIANSIRAKTGESGTIDASSFDTTISGITTPPLLQDKEVTITTDTTTNITCDNNYDGLGTVSVITSVGGGGIEKGVEFSEYNSDGYPEKAEIKGMTSLPNYFFYVGYDGSVASKIKTVVLPDSLQQLNISCFYNCKQLQTINIPTTLYKLGQECFKNCTNLVLTELPSSVSQMGSGIFYGCSSIKEMKFNYQTTLPSNCFYNCSSLKKFLGVNTTGVPGSNTGNSGFYNCQNLKQIWLGNKLNGNLMYRWSFASCPNIEKIYINEPRATVSSWTNYQYAFMNDANKKSVIICNDDEGFITQEQFEALDPDTM